MDCKSPSILECCFRPFAVAFHWQPATCPGVPWTGRQQLLLHDGLQFLRKQGFGARVVSLSCCLGRSTCVFLRSGRKIARPPNREQKQRRGIKCGDPLKRTALNMKQNRPDSHGNGHHKPYYVAQLPPAQWSGFGWPPPQDATLNGKA